MTLATADPTAPQVGILVLNYHHPEETLACVRSLLAREGPGTRILWLENDAAETGTAAEAVLAASGLAWARVDPALDPLPGPGVVGYIANPENLGYAGGNNVGLRFLQRHAVPFAWVLNNDTLLVEGSSRDLLEAAAARPGVGIWATRITTERSFYYGGVVNPRTQGISLCQDLDRLEGDADAFVSGCSLFFRTGVAAAMGFLPEHYFLYYEDPAFSLEMKRRGLGLAGTDAVVVQHAESLSTGRRSMLMEYYSKRNRWHFMQAYYPHRLGPNRWRLLYDLQGYLFRLRGRRAWVEWIAFLDFRRGVTGPTGRPYSRFQVT